MDGVVKFDPRTSSASSRSKATRLCGLLSGLDGAFGRRRLSAARRFLFRQAERAAEPMPLLTFEIIRELRASDRHLRLCGSHFLCAETSGGRCGIGLVRCGEHAASNVLGFFLAAALAYVAFETVGLEIGSEALSSELPRRSLARGFGPSRAHRFERCRSNGSGSADASAGNDPCIRRRSLCRRNLAAACSDKSRRTARF